MVQSIFLYQVTAQLLHFILFYVMSLEETEKSKNFRPLGGVICKEKRKVSCSRGVNVHNRPFLFDYYLIKQSARCYCEPLLFKDL